MEEKDVKAIQTALNLAVRANAEHMALIAAIAKNGALQIDTEFYEQERDRLITELGQAVEKQIYE